MTRTRGNRPSYVPDTELLARRVLRDVEPELSRHLGVARLDPGFVAELYVWVRQELYASNPEGGAIRERALPESLALTIYLVTATQQARVESSPDLIPRLQRVIARTLAEADPAGLAGTVTG